MKLYLSGALPISWILLLTMQLVSCQPSTKVILVTGSGTSSNNAEIFDMATGTLCNCPKVQPFPFDRLYGASGGIVNRSPMICGGHGKINGQWNVSTTRTTCHSLNQQGHWIEDHVAWNGFGRVHSGSVVLQNQLHMVGGSDRLGYHLNSILALEPNTRPKVIYALPHGLKDACVVPWNDTTMLVTGGWSGKYETRTHFVNIETETVTPGPALQIGRYDHGCQEIMVQGQPYIMVGGGWGPGATTSTEMLKKDIGQSWTKVADMPGVAGHNMVASPGKDIVYSFGPGNKIFKFSCPEDQIQHCQWEEMETRLTYPRRDSVAMTIPDDLANKLC